MKKISILLLFACICFVNCDNGEETENIRFLPYECTFDKEGGDTTLILIEPRFRNWYISSIIVLPLLYPDVLSPEMSEEERKEIILDTEKDKSWYKITKLDNGDMHVAVGKNNKNYDRTIIISIDYNGNYFAGGNVFIRQTK